MLGMFTLQRLKRGVLRREPTAACDINDQQHLASMITEGLFDTFDRTDGELVDGGHTDSE